MEISSSINKIRIGDLMQIGTKYRENVSVSFVPFQFVTSFCAPQYSSNSFSELDGTNSSIILVKIQLFFKKFSLLNLILKYFQGQTRHFKKELKQCTDVDKINLTRKLGAFTFKIWMTRIGEK